jgi:uncharacterized protein (DUF2235 family)
VYHWRSAARWRGLTWEHWCRLDVDAQAGYLAEYETELRLSALEAEWQRKEQERKQKAAQQRQAAQRGMRRRRR